MFDALPLSQLREEDSPIYGTDLIRLAQLSHQNFPVAEGLVITPPDFHLKTVLKHFEINNVEIFEQSLALVKQEVLKIPPPETLVKSLHYKSIDVSKLWHSLLLTWLEEMRTKIWRQGFEAGVTEQLSPQPIFFTKNILASGSAYYDKHHEKVIIQAEQGSLSVAQQADLDDLVRRASRKLFLPYTYHFIIQKNKGLVELVRLSPYTDHPEKKSVEYIPEIKPVLTEKPLLQTVVKVFVDRSKPVLDYKLGDGSYVSVDETTSFDSLTTYLAEVGQNTSSKPLLFKFSDKKQRTDGVRGTLNLLHNDRLFNLQTDAYLFCKQKKALENIELVIPFVRSVNEFAELKKRLVLKNINRRGHKLWLEIATPENILNIQEYLTSGVDGIIMDLDELSAWVSGFNSNLAESHFYGHQVEALVKMIEPVLKTVHEQKIPVLCSGKLSLNSDILQLLVTKGFLGIIADPANAVSLPDYLHFLEKRHVNKLS